jgi:hypothetical protein
MPKFLAVIFLITIFASSIFGCQQLQTNTPAKATIQSKSASSPLTPRPTRTRKPTETLPSVTTLPMGSSWAMGIVPVANKGNVSIGLHVVVITDQYIILAYSASNSLKVKSNIDAVKLIDNNGNEYKLLDSTILAKTDGIRLESVTFEGPKLGANRLDLITQYDAAQLKVNVAQADPPGSQPELIEGMQIMLPRENYFDQEDARVSFYSGPYTSDAKLSQNKI